MVSTDEEVTTLKNTNRNTRTAPMRMKHPVSCSPTWMRRPLVAPVDATFGRGVAQALPLYTA